MIESREIQALVLVSALLVLSAFFSGSEAAVFSLQATDREAIRGRGRAGRLVEALLSHPHRTLASLLLGNEFVNVTLSATCAALVLRLWPGHAWVNLVIATPLLVFLAEVAPKSFAMRFRRAWCRAVAEPLSIWVRLVAPLRWVLARAAEAVARLLGAGRRAEGALHEAHVRRLIDQGHEAGAIGEMEQEIIHAVFEFSDIPVSRLMTPRPDIVSASLSMPYARLLELVRQHGFSRIPIYQGRPDDVVGVLMTKDLLRFRDVSEPGPRQIKSLLQDPFFVPMSKPAGELLGEFQRRRTHVALLVDEHGSIAGLVTLDDLLRELVGDWRDENDAEDQEIDRIRPDVWTVPGAMDLDDFARETGIELPRGEYHTLAGYVFSQLGHLPEKGESVEREGVSFAVTGIEGRRITEITVRSAEPGAEEGP